MAVELPATELAKAAKLSFARKLYPSYRYTLALNRSPGLIGAARSPPRAAAAARDEDRRRRRRHRSEEPLLRPAGVHVPARLPEGRHEVDDAEGDRRPFLRGRRRRRPHAARRRPAGVVPRHARGRDRRRQRRHDRPGRADHPRTTGLSGVAPRAYIGNYRVFNVPTPVGHVGNTPEIVSAFEAAVRDGMDVINFSGGGPQTDPLSDAMIETVRNVAAAGVVPVISAGNDRDDYGVGSAGSPGTAPTRSRSRRSRTRRSSRRRCP